MTELRPCPQCKRHVKLAAATCPFCATSLPAARAQYARPIAFTRAAIFSAALAACSDHKAPATAPVAGSSHEGSDDLDNLLDQQPRTAEHPASPADAAVDATQVAEAIDAAVAADAGVDPKIAEQKRREALRRKLEAEKRRQDELLRQRQHIMNKPYGAPPARRRVV